jgi:2-polyprenyl-3-methyl-5-hydroxy-6-metoxy-1,4-benzoquinol methylase
LGYLACRWRAGVFAYPANEAHGTHIRFRQKGASMAEYTLAQADDPSTERERLGLLEAVHDPWTIANFQTLGVAAGWRCIDIGAGGGSIARWLAERVGSTGSVLAIDLDLRLLEPLATPTLSARRLDVRHDELPKDADLVHSRFLLEHLPEYESVLQRMIRAVRTGGWLVVTDADFRTVRLSEPDAAFDRVAASFLAAIRTAGWNTQLGPSLSSLFENAGLVDVAAASWQTYSRGSAHAVLFAETYKRLRALLIRHGAKASEIDRAVKRLVSREVGFFGPTTWTAWGRRA